MVRTLILYESRYGFTKMVAKNLALILGPAKYCRVTELESSSKDCDVLVICVPVYLEMPDCSILEYLSENADWIKRKKVVILCTCLAVTNEAQYLKPLKEILGQSIVFHAVIPGELVIEKLSSSDCVQIKQFCSHTGLEFTNYKLFNKEKFIELALNIKKIKDQGKNIISENNLKQYIDKFINERNTCVLATGHKERVRATPIEYVYKDNAFYILSEGGEKFSNILLNPNVSIGIFDEYKNMNQLGGMQIKGTAEIINIGNDEYISVLMQKKLNYEKIKALSVNLNMIKINISVIEFIWSEFNQMGYDTKQILYMN